ncbi:hypothetical protein WA026_004902 [Henosepilachna vigintioctopunctata]
MFHYTTGIEPMHFILVEFKNESDVVSTLSSSTFVEGNSTTPVNSQFLWFRSTSKKITKSKHKNAALVIEDGITPMTNDRIRETLQKCNNVTEQILTLYNNTKMTDLECRLRFLTARQMELSVYGMFPHARVLPFGSSVNGFGKMGCDLDVVLTLKDNKEDSSSRLVFHCKDSGVDRSSNLRNLEVFGDLLQLFLPGCARVRKILQARVPIIKYYHQFTDVECDLSMCNVSGVHMSDFLYIMGSIDSRVRPLVFAIRKWAQEVGLTNSSPGRWITNFSLTLLVLAFLQGPLHSPPILPSLNTLVKSAESKDSFITDEGVNCSFLRDIEKLHFSSVNIENLEVLLCEFFEYYSQFDFKSKSVCLNEGVPLTKLDHSALYIINPLERGLNVSKNVSLEELEKFKFAARNAAWILQSEESTNTSNWGLLSIFDKPNKKMAFSVSRNKNERLMQVKQLFEEEDNTDTGHSEVDNRRTQLEKNGNTNRIGKTNKMKNPNR